MREIKPYAFALLVTGIFAVIIGLTRGLHGIQQNGVAFLALYFGTLAYAQTLVNNDKITCECAQCRRLQSELRKLEEQQKGMNL